MAATSHPSPPRQDKKPNLAGHIADGSWLMLSTSPATYTSSCNPLSDATEKAMQRNKGWQTRGKLEHLLCVHWLPSPDNHTVINLGRLHCPWLPQQAQELKSPFSSSATSPWSPTPSSSSSPSCRTPRATATTTRAKHFSCARGNLGPPSGCHRSTSCPRSRLL